MGTAEDLSLAGLRIARNAAYLLVSDVGVRVVTAFVAILVARYLGPEQYGILSIALALLGVAAYLSDLGVTPVMIREGTKPGAPIPRILFSSLRLRLIFALGTTGVMAAVAWFYYPHPLTRLVILVVVMPGIWAGVLRGLSTGYFQMVQEMQYMALVNAVAGLAGAAVLLVSVALRWPLFLVALGYGSSAVVGGVLGVLLLRREVLLEKGWHPALVQDLWAFTLSGGLGLLGTQLGPLILPHAAGLETTGFFTAAHRVPLALMAVPSVVATAFYPQLFVLGQQDPQRHVRWSLREVRIMSSLCLAMAIPLAFQARWVINFLLGPEWIEKSGPALALLAGYLAWAGLARPLADSLTTQGLQARRTWVQGLGVVLGAGLYWVLGQTFGAVGAAGAALGVEFVQAVGFVVSNPRAKELVMKGLFPWVMKAGFCTGAAYGVTQWMGVTWRGFVGTGVVSACMVVALDKDLREEIRALSKWVLRTISKLNPFGEGAQ